MNTSICLKMTIILFSCLVFPANSFSQALTEYAIENERKIWFGQSSIDVFEDSFIFRSAVDFDQHKGLGDKSRFVVEVAEHISKNSTAGYSKEAATRTAEKLYQASLSQKLLAEGHLKKVAEIRGAIAAVHIDQDGRIAFSEMIQYKPKGAIYCEREGRLSVPINSAVPCLTKKKKGKQQRLTKLPTEVKQLLDDWRKAYMDLPARKHRKELLAKVGYDPTKYLRLPDDQLWPFIWSSSTKTLVQKFTFVPIFANQSIISGLDLSTVSMPRPGKDKEQRLLTGFTIDENEEWSERWDTSIEICLFWYLCETYYYYIEPYYNYSYLFGLRVPMLLDVESSNVHFSGSTYTGKLTVGLEPYDGNSSHYAAAGLPASLRYSGKEILARLCHKSCGAGVRGNVPGPDPLPITASVSTVNLIKKLPASWSIRNEQLDAPDVGENRTLGSTKINFDLLFGNASIGIAGAQLYPWLRFDMEGEEKSIKVKYTKDNPCNISGYNKELVYSSASPKSFNFTLDSTKWVTFKKHNYTFDVKMTPGLGPEVWVDLGLWSDDWSYGPWYFPWGVESPDIKLNRHNETNCGMYFKVTD